MIPESPAGPDLTRPVPPRTDLSSSMLHRHEQPLGAFFSPRTVAVLGATDSADSIGRAVLWNLVTNPFGGTVFPVNPEHASVLGIKAYPALSAVPEKVDLAVVATPAESVPDLVAECVEAGVKAAVILSAGFKETGPAGLKIEETILANARRGTLRIIGPNCLGVMSPLTGLNATYAGGMARAGNVAFLSQSSALCTAVLDWSLREMVGFSSFISVGSMLDVGWGDLIDYLGEDQRTRSILIYMESIGDARAFLSAAREVALTKPIILIKGGRTEPSVRAAASHTGSLAGADEQEMEPLARRISKGGIPAEITPTIERDLWAKMLYNCCLNPLGAVLEQNYGSLGDSESTRAIMDAIAEETFAVMRAAGFRTHWDDAAGFLRDFHGQMVPATYAHRSSMLQDLEAGRRTEIDAMSGAVVELGERRGITTPLNRIMRDLVRFKESQAASR